MKHTTPIKVLLWAPYGAGIHYDGAGMNAFRLYSQFPASSIVVDLVHGNPSQERYPLFNAQHFIGNIRFAGPLGQILFLINAKKWIASNIHEYDLFHGLYAFHHTVLPAHWAQKKGCKTVIKLANHKGGLDDHKGVKGLIRLPEKRRHILRSVSAAVAISSDIESELHDHGITRNTFRIPNGVDCTRFSPASSSTRHSLRDKLEIGHRFTILFVGEVVPRKQPDLLIRALRQLLDLNVDCQLVLVGPSPDADYSAELHKLVHELQVGNSVIRREFTADVSDYYKVADVFALPSRNEGMSNALLEAMASGLPSIVTPVSGSVDLVDDGVNGFYIGNDVETVVSAVMKYSTGEALYSRHSAGARHKITSTYDLSLIASAYQELFFRIAKDRVAN